MKSRRLVVCASVLVLLLQCAWLAVGGAARFPSFPLDDAWIHQVYARAIADGHGFSYGNAVPSAGCSSPLWALLLAIPASCGADPVLAGSALSLGFALAATLAASWFVVRLSAKLTAIEPPLWWGAFTLLFVGASPVLAWNAGAGMEGCAAAAFVLLGLALRLGETDAERRLGAFCFGLSVAFRLETVVVLPLLAVERCGWTEGRLAKAWGAAGDAALACLPWMVLLTWMHARTGRFLPQTIEAKVGDRALFHMLATDPNAGLVLAGRMVSGVVAVVRTASLDGPLALALLGASLVVILKLGRPSSWLPLLLPGGLVVLQPFAMELLPQPGGAFSHEGRYVVQLQMVAASLLAAGVLNALRLTQDARYRNERRVVLVILALHSWLWLWMGLRGAQRAAANRREIAGLQVELGKWLGAHAAPGDEIAARDVGAVGYFAEQAKLVDLFGLVSPEVLVARRSGVAFVRGPNTRYVEVFLGEFGGLTADCQESVRRTEPKATNPGRKVMVVLECPHRVGDRH